MTIWKYPVEMAGLFTIAMPQGAHVLTVQTQGNAPQLWALVDPKQPVEPRRFLMLGTGHDISYQPGRYIGTFQVDGGTFVFHVFESMPV